MTGAQIAIRAVMRGLHESGAIDAENIRAVVAALRAVDPTIICSDLKIETALATLLEQDLGEWERENRASS